MSNSKEIGTTRGRACASQASTGEAVVPNIPTYEQLRAGLASVCRKYAAAIDALEFADSEGFQWPHDPLGSMAMAFADPNVVPEYALLAPNIVAVTYGHCVSCGIPHRVKIEQGGAA